MIKTKTQEDQLPLKMLTMKDITFILDIHPNTVRRREKKGLLKSYRIEPIIA